MSKIGLLAAALLVALGTRAAGAAPLVTPLPDPAQAPAPLAYVRPMRIVEVAPPRPRVVAKPKKPGPKMRPMRVTATAYALRGRTARGTYVKKGTIAVDPRLIPLGTRIYVPGYGWGTALDTGGAIRGNVIDLWMPSTRECFSWGVRTVQILVEQIEPVHRRPKPVTVASRGVRAHTTSGVSRAGRAHPVELASRGGRPRPHPHHAPRETEAGLGARLLGGGR
jgi:3D (Asp-Asp-Asp) domain-containing protein